MKLSSEQYFFEYNYVHTSFSLKIHWRFSTILKTGNKSVWNNVFWYIKVRIFWKCTQYTTHWDKTNMLKKFLSDKFSGTKISLFFFSWAPTYHSFTFNLRFLYELKYKVRFFKTVYGMFSFQFRFVSIKVYIFVQQNAWTPWHLNIIIPSKIKTIEKPHTALLPDLWVLRCNKKF